MYAKGHRVYKILYRETTFKINFFSFYFTSSSTGKVVWLLNVCLHQLLNKVLSLESNHPPKDHMQENMKYFFMSSASISGTCCAKAYDTRHGLKDRQFHYI